MSDLNFDEVFDFVVVGSGGGSMCAALVMRKAGKSVAILEKTDLIGGTTSRSGGVLWIPNNPFMREEGIEDSYEKAMEYMEATAGQSLDAPGTTLEKRRAYVTEAPRMIDFLVEQGIKLRRSPSWPDYYDERPGGSVPGRTVLADLFDTNELGEWKERLRPNFMEIPAYHSEGFEISTFKSSWKGKLAMLRVGLRVAAAKLTGKSWTTAGGALQGRMLKAALGAGATLRVDSPVKGFILEGGAVKGVVTTKDGRDWRIGSRSGVLVNAGGFSQNQAMRDKYMPGTSVEWTAAGPGDTGEMIESMEAMGAALAQMNERVGNQMTIPPGHENTNGQGVGIGAVSGQMNYAKPHSIVVDQTGVRYMNEGGSYMAFCQNVLKRNETVPALPSWWISDEQSMRKYLFCGTMPGTKKPQEWYDSGFLFRADTIEELARLIQVEPEQLRKTVDRFNVGARKGRDDEFRRGQRAYDEWLGDHYHHPSNTLGAIEQGPFYAARVWPGDVGTYGGVVTDVHGRVLREDGSAIEGLYATGTSTASVMGRVYPGAGSSVGPSFVFGYIAARYAANAGNMP
ncbi:3-ketosteroid-delta-1-dehydrogenase [Novosphingobium barchaimii LL02]|uniref:3-ketosteroid-delta-1-dehydrogenase n=1 Tax=Novosphingobium barchaimii LL02 TaxID=1114963 RepID=A0A0J7XK11_9SPHN|nr:FAD-dependent oxidoreductase [Novosphingobium barchaimii]KMS52032.1 3-ketosteroid-delta-1-dehydrogenase [Novosphingobium barchaimii LL02]